MLLRPSLRARSRARVIVAATALFAVISFLLPYDSPIWLAFRFNASRLRIYLQSGLTDDSWLYRLPKYPINITEDVGLIIKTGYGTQQRLPAILEALETGFASRDIAVIADFSPDNMVKYYYNGDEVHIHDIFAIMLENESLNWLKSTHRFGKYLNMTAAMNDGNTEAAQEIGTNFGWELDAMKFIPGLRLVFDLFPRKKWYIVLDDDTYLIRPSMRLLLEHLDPDIPQYVGNPVGDFKGRFAHGGSSIILSRPVLHRLFIQNPKVAYEAYSEGLTETWGDKLVATTLMKLGIYLDERYERLFNGESPLATRIWLDRFCLPLVAFHSLATPQHMSEVGDLFKDIDDPVLWSDIWTIYQAPSLDSMLDNPIRMHEDHVGRTDGSTTKSANVPNAHACLEACNKRSKCLAWAWDASRRSCNVSPWMIVGYGPEGMSSGVDVPQVRKLLNNCHRDS